MHTPNNLFGEHRALVVGGLGSNFGKEISHSSSSANAKTFFAQADRRATASCNNCIFSVARAVFDEEERGER